MASRARAALVAVALTTCGWRPALADAPPARMEDRQLHFHGGRAVVGMAAGGLGGLLMAAAGAAIGREVVCQRLSCDDWEGTFFGLAVGYVLGVPGGVALAWHHEGGTSPYVSAFIGSVTGGLIGIGLAREIEPEAGSDAASTLIVLIAGPVIGATLAVALGHQHGDDGVPPVGALLQLRDGELAAGFPIPLRTTIDGMVVTTMPLAAGRF